MYKFSLILFVASLLCSCNQKQYRQMDGAVWNTAYHITYCSEAPLDDSVRSVMREVELSLSPFNKSSLISAINRGEPAVADGYLRKVMECSKMVNRLSGGMYDPTLSPLINLWGFGYASADSIPSEADIEKALESVGIDRCYITESGEIIKKSPATEFNFSSITKGLACDEIGAMFRRNGCSDYMIEIGGEIALSGVSQRGGPWRIAVEAPEQNLTPGSRKAIRTLSLTNCGIATSGNYRNFHKDTAGHTFGHTISAVTGHPVETSTLSTTVVAPDCMLADALATAAMTVAPDSALSIARQLPGVWIMLVVATPENQLSILSAGTEPQAQ